MLCDSRFQVTRSINGNMLRNRLDVWSEGRHGVKELFDQSGEEASRERLKRGLPIPVCKFPRSFRTIYSV